MKTSKIIAAAALALLAAAGAQAETYEGVHPLTTLNNRADVQAEAVVAAHSENPYATGYSAGVAPVFTSSADRSAVNAQAVATAHAPNQNLKSEAFVNSKVPTQFAIAAPVINQASDTSLTSRNGSGATRALR